MKISHNINTTILTDNNLLTLKHFAGEEIISDIEGLKTIKSDFVVFNDVLRHLKEKDLVRFFQMLEEKNIHFVNITSNVEESLYAVKMIVMHEEKIVLEGLTISVLKEEKILKRLGYKLPFIVDLSLQLNYYGLIDSIFLDENVLVGKLW